MPIPYHQITNFMNSKMYQDKKHPAHKQANDFIDVWFQNNADKLDENNNFKESVVSKSSVSDPLVLDDELIKRNIPEIKKHEGVKDFPYKDTKGIITVGGGLNVDNFDKYASLDWVNKNTGQKATPDEIKADYTSIKNTPSRNYQANFYEKYTVSRLSDAQINKQMVDHLKSDLAQIRRAVPNFDKLPTGVQDAVIDIQYNTGHIEKFPKMIQAIQDKNIRSVAEESHRKDVSQDRNQDMIQKILQIIDWDY
ncbi:MAG: hypothetical protein IKV03_03835 [Alphaproteobacteria bacterium]|nr:hypothetical protein [Alphaproteobacteria bacterium]